MAIINNLSIEEVYNKIAGHFDSTRQYMWKCAKNFIEKLPSNTKLLDIGCGNGKNILYRKDLESVGIDISDEQVNICRKKGLNVVKSNMTNLPFTDLYFDNIICIASYHHLNNDIDRKKALYEMYRVLKNNGTILLTVWAQEQEINSKRQFNSSDQIVPWISKEGDTYYRYYHIYKKGELEKEIKSQCPIFNIKSIELEKGNWCAILTKTSISEDTK